MRVRQVDNDRSEFVDNDRRYVPYDKAPEMLRKIADDIESGLLKVKEV